MKKSFKYYAVIWFVALAIFNVACFVSPAKLGDFSKYDAMFWTGYAFITVAFLGQLACAYKAFDTNSKEKFFLNVSLISVSYTVLIVISVFGVLCMAIPDLPNRIGIIACFAVPAFSIIAVVSAHSAIDTVSETENKVKSKTVFIKLLSAESDALVRKAESDGARNEAKRVFEAIRYSDPMSNMALNSIETEISVKFGEFSAAVKSGDSDRIKKLADGVCDLIADRNVKCKTLK